MSDLNVVATFIDSAIAFEAATTADNRYSPEYKAQLVQESWSAAKAQAQQAAQQLLATAEQQATTAAERLTALEQHHSAGIDTARQSMAHVEAQTLAATVNSFDQVESAAMLAVRLRDEAALRSMVKVALPTLIKSAAPDLTPLHNDRGRLESLRQQLEAQLLELEPEPLKQARQAATEAAQAHQRLASDIDRLNWRYSQRMGGRGPLDQPAPIFSVVDKTLPAYQTKQRWP